MFSGLIPAFGNFGEFVEDEEGLGVEEEDDEEDEGVTHVALVIVFVSNVTAPLRASTRPSTLAPVVRVADVKAKIFPLKVEFAPSVAELPTCQKTLQA